MHRICYNVRFSVLNPQYS